MNIHSSLFHTKRHFLKLSLALSASILLIACGAKTENTTDTNSTHTDLKSTTGNAVRVSSKLDTEGNLLGNLILQVLNEQGIPTVNKIQLGTTPVLRGALEAGELDIYPEYTGNGAFIFSDEKNPAWKDPKLGYELVKRLDYDKNKIVWLQPSPASNTWTIALRKDISDSNHIKSLEDLSKWLAAGGNFKIAASAEFIERPDALPSFEKTYGFKLKQDNILTLAGGDTTVFAKAAAEKTSGVNAALSYATDGAISSLGLIVLTDSKSSQPVYAPTPIIREEVLKKYPQIEEALKPVFASLDIQTLQQLNAQIAIEGKDAKVVAMDYLKIKGFIK